MTSFVATKKQQESLAFGYIRTNAKDINVPIVLTRLCLWFYDENLYLIFGPNNRKIQSLMALAHGKAILDNVLPNRPSGILFRCMLQKPGDHLVFSLWLLGIPNNVKSMTISYKMFYVQKNVKWGKMIKTTHQHWDKYFKETRKGQFVIHSPYLALSECKNEEQLEFIGHLNVLNFQYKDGSECIPHQIIKINVSNSIKWTFNKSEMKMIADSKKFIGPTSNDNCWGIRWKRKRVVIQLLQYPQTIAKINVKYCVVYIFDTKKSEIMDWKSKEFIVDQCYNHKMKKCVQVPLQVKVYMIICDVWDKENKKIPCHEWYKYDVIHSS